MSRLFFHFQKLIFERINLVCLSSFAFGIVCSCLPCGSKILEKSVFSVGQPLNLHFDKDVDVDEVDVVAETLDEDMDVVQVRHQVKVQVMMKLQYPAFQHSQDIEAANKT